MPAGFTPAEQMRKGSLAASEPPGKSAKARYEHLTKLVELYK